MTEDETKAAKVKFAAFLLKTPTEPFQAGCAVFPDDTRMALWSARHWVGDAEVMAEMERLKKKGEDLDSLPGKAEQLRSIWELTQHGLYEDRIKAHKLYADIKGHIDKTPAVAVNVNNNRVMVIRDQGTNEEWEAKVAKQQSDLLNAAATRH